MIINGQKLHDRLLDQEDGCYNYACFPDHGQCADPLALAFMAIRLLVEGEDDIRSGERSNGPQEDGHWDFQRLQDQRVLADSGADESADCLEHER